MWFLVGVVLSEQLFELRNTLLLCCMTAVNSVGADCESIFAVIAGDNSPGFVLWRVNLPLI